MNIGRFFEGKKILITGHSGFKGSWLSELLLGMGATVIGYSLEPETTPNLFTALGLHERMKNHFHDIRDYEKVSSVMANEEPEMVIHMAAQPLVRDSYDDPLYTFSTNVMGTANVLEAIRHCPSVKAVVIVTTDKVYENRGEGKTYRENDELGGYDPYSSSKVCAEHVARSYIRSFFNPEAFDREPEAFIATARAGNVLGGGDWSKDRLVPDMIRAILERKDPVVLRNPDSVRPWQFVLDPLFGYLFLAKRLYEKDRKAVGAWNFAPEQESFITAEELVKLSVRKLGQGEYRIIPEEGKHETALLKLDARKAKQKLGWKPLLDIGECLDWTFEWYGRYYEKEDVLTLTREQIRGYFKRLEG